MLGAESKAQSLLLNQFSADVQFMIVSYLTHIYVCAYVLIGRWGGGYFYDEICNIIVIIKQELAEFECNIQVNCIFWQPAVIPYVSYPKFAGPTTYSNETDGPGTLVFGGGQCLPGGGRLLLSASPKFLAKASKDSKSYDRCK